MDINKELHELCETLSRELADLNEKIRKAGGKMSAVDLDVIDKMTHAIKSVKAVMAMSEEEEGGEYSNYSRRGSYDEGPGGSYRGGSYRGGYSGRRDSMGRYAREYGYARNDLAGKMRELLEDAPDDRTRQDLQRMIEKLESN